MTLVLAAGSMLDVTTDELVAAAAGAGFHGVGMRLTGPHRPRRAEALRTIATAAGIVLHDAEVHRIGAGSADATIAEAAELGIGRLLVVSDVADLDTTARELEQIVAVAARRNVAIGLEYMAWTTPSNPTDAMALAARTGCELVVDLLHHVRVGAGPDELTAIVESGRLGWVQLCDAPAAAPTTGEALVHEARHARAEPGAGQLPLAALLARVPAGVTVSVEVQSDALMSLPPAERARRLYRASTGVLGGNGARGASGDRGQPNSTG